MRRRPEEIDAAQEADEQRRVAERRQRAADVRDEEDEEDDDMALKRRSSLARIIGRIMIIEAPVVPTTAGEHRADDQQDRVRRRAVQLPETRCRPPIVNSANSRMMKGRYSSSMCAAQRRVRATGSGRLRLRGRARPGLLALRRPDRDRRAAAMLAAIRRGVGALDQIARARCPVLQRDAGAAVDRDRDLRRQRSCYITYDRSAASSEGDMTVRRVIRVSDDPGRARLERLLRPSREWRRFLPARRRFALLRGLAVTAPAPPGRRRAPSKGEGARLLPAGRAPL
jgi:hypothetical protein